MGAGSRDLPRTPLRAVAAALLVLGGAAACVHHPRRVELHTYSREEALRRCELALRTRFANVLQVDADLGRIRTDERYVEDANLRRSRAYVALTPGEFGWAAELTVVRERLETGGMGFSAAPARWTFDGRDDLMEAYLAEEISLEVADLPTFDTREHATTESSPARDAPGVRSRP